MNSSAQSSSGSPATPPAPSTKPSTPLWKLLAPLAVAIVVAFIPTPEGLAPHAWYFFAIFLGCVVGLILEPFPGAVVGLIGVTLVALLSPLGTVLTSTASG